MKKNKIEIEMWVKGEEYGLDYLTPNPKYKTYNFYIKFYPNKNSLIVTEKTWDFRGGRASIAFTVKNEQQAENIIDSITSVITV